KGRIRVDDLEMRADVQQEVAELWKQATTENLPEISDIAGYRNAFFQLFGFNFENIDYEKDTSELVLVPSLEH
ncbi:MAG: bifunctional NADH-specific enoyl-ACP reductase/trans-2-enoyl-CoA reductase, partial [Sphingobacterium sp.]